MEQENTKAENEDAESGSEDVESRNEDVESRNEDAESRNEASNEDAESTTTTIGDNTSISTHYSSSANAYAEYYKPEFKSYHFHTRPHPFGRSKLIASFLTAEEAACFAQGFVESRTKGVVSRVATNPSHYIRTSTTDSGLACFDFVHPRGETQRYWVNHAPETIEAMISRFITECARRMYAYELRWRSWTESAVDTENIWIESEREYLDGEFQGMTRCTAHTSKAEANRVALLWQNPLVAMGVDVNILSNMIMADGGFSISADIGGGRTTRVTVSWYVERLHGKLVVGNGE